MAAVEQHTADADGEGDELPVGTILLRGSYQLTQFIASGGFGKTYLAKDNLDRTVVIKECFPSAVCFRKGNDVVAMSRASENEFRTLVEMFKSEARNLSKLDHANIVKVHQVFDDNNTAYMVLDYVEGRDLASLLAERTKPLPPEKVTAIATKLIDAVATIHASDVLHRDISPDNILLTDESEPVLIDFGAARQVAIATSRKLSAMRMVKDGYSPQEFYSSTDDMHFASDLYSLAASLHHAIVGYPPPNAQERVLAVGSGMDDPYRPIALQARGYERGFLEAIDRALGLFPIERPQTVKEWRQLQKGQRIPNRAGRQKSDPSQDLIKQLVHEDDTGPVEPEINEALRPLRHFQDAAQSVSKSRSPKLYASLTLMGCLAAASIYLNSAASAPVLSLGLSSLGLTSNAARPLSSGSLTLADGTVLALYKESDRAVTWVASTRSDVQSLWKRGDVLVSSLPERTAITSPEILRTLIDDARRLGRHSMSIAVWRDGEVLTIPLDISTQTFDSKS